MTFQSTTASELLVRIGILQRQIVESSAKGFGNGETIRAIGELGHLVESLEEEAVREHLSTREVA